LLNTLQVYKSANVLVTPITLHVRSICEQKYTNRDTDKLRLHMETSTEISIQITLLKQNWHIRQH